MIRHSAGWFLVGVLWLAVLSACASQDVERPATDPESNTASLEEELSASVTAYQQGRFAEAEEEAAKTVERFLVHLRDNDYDAAKELSVDSVRSNLDGTDKGIPDPAWDYAWRKIHSGIFSWKKDGWGTSIGKLYGGYSPQSAVEERHKPVLRARDETFVILAYTLKHSGESDTALDFILLPTEQGWRISEISIVGDKPPAQNVLRFQDVTSDHRQIDGVAHLFMEGQVANPSSQPQSIPPMVATLMDSDGTELKRWTFHAEATEVPAGGSVPFQTSTANPPGKGNLNINFLRLVQTEQGRGISEISIVGDKPAQRVVLRIHSVTSDLRHIEGEQHLIIEGQIVNPTNQPQNVPPLVFTLFDPDGTELKRWTFHAEATVVPAGGRVPFQTSIADPPSQGNLDINFSPLVQ